MLHGHILVTIAQNVCRTADFQTFEKLCETILLPCNSKGLMFDFYLHRKRNKCWLAAYSFQLFTWQYFGRDASSGIYHPTLPAMLKILRDWKI